MKRPSTLFKTSTSLVVMTLAALVMVPVDGASESTAFAADTCTASYEGVQYARKDKKLRAAKKAAIVCTQSSCASDITNECLQWLRDLDQAIPSVVVVAKDGSGAEVSNVTVSFDGERLATTLDGSPLDVDPGEHTFKFERPGAPAVEQKIILRAGERNRILQIALPGPNDVKAAPKEQPVAIESSQAPSRNLTPIFVVGGIGLAAIATGAVLGITVLSGKSDCESKRDAGTPCSEDEVSGLRTRRTLTDVALGVGIVSVGVATVLFLTGGKSEAPKSAKPHVLPVVNATARGGYVGLNGTF